MNNKKSKIKADLPWGLMIMVKISAIWPLLYLKLN